MKQWQQYFRLVLLIIGVAIVVAETADYYTGPEIKPAETQLSELLQPPLIASPPPATQPPNFDSRVTSFERVKTVDAVGIVEAQLSFTGATQSAITTDVDVYRLEYEIVDRNGEWQSAIADVYVPRIPDQVPLYVFGSGTTGLADKCAPSLENVAIENLGNYDNQMISQASVGFVSVFPDYEGFHSDQETQAYFIVESEAKVLLGAIQSLYSLQGEKKISTIDFDHVFLAGYSQGGHAALSTAQNWSELPTSIKLEGVIQFAGAADVNALFLESPWLAPYLVESFTAYYPNLSAEGVLQSRWLEVMAANNLRLCVNQAYRTYPRDPVQMYTPVFLDALQSATWPTELLGWQTAIQNNTPLAQLPNVPYLSIQGVADPIVTAQAQQHNVDVMCQEDKHVEYKEYPGVNHFQIRQVSFGFATNWMRNVIAGVPVPSSCPP